MGSAGVHSAPPICLAPIPDLWARFPPFARRYDHKISSSSLQSEKRTQRPTLGATRNLRCRSDFVMARRHRWRPEVGVAPTAPADCARPLSFPGFCCGPRCTAIWRAEARHLTAPRGPRDDLSRRSRRRLVTA